MSSSAARTLGILDCVAAAGRPLSVTEIARALSLSPGTAFRGLDALVRCGLVARYQASSRYMLGAAAEQLRQSLITRFKMRDVVLPYLRQLASVSGETTSLHVRLGWYAVRIASAPGTAEVTNSPPLGETQPLGELCSGRTILAYLPRAELARYRAWAARNGAASPKSAELQRIRVRGFTEEEEGSGIAAAVAFPIRSHSQGESGTAITSIAIEGPVLSSGDPTSETVLAWREIVARVEALARTQPVLFENPFAHLDADEVRLA